MGKLIFQFHTRPDFTHDLSVVSQFMHASLKSHLKVVYKIVRYLKVTSGKGVMFQRKGVLRLEAYTDAN